MKRYSIGAAVVIGLAVVAGAVALGTNLLRSDGPDVSASLQRPAVGQVRADHLADGTPVWVIGHQDGSVDVLSGFGTHTPFNLGKMLWWCPGARALDDPAHGSKWDEYGVRLSGPAPLGLASWQVDVLSSGVFVGAQRPPPPIDTQPDGPAASEREWCLGPGDDVIFHTFDDWRLWESPTAAVESAPGGWILLAGELVVDPAEERVLLCAPTGCGDSVVAANVVVPDRPELELEAPGGSRFIARVRDGELVDVTRVVFLGAEVP